MKRHKVPLKCIVCKSRRRTGTLFCDVCIKKDLLVKLKAFQKSKEFRVGLSKRYEYEYE